jgi:hypothetical protein
MTRGIANGFALCAVAVAVLAACTKQKHTVALDDQLLVTESERMCALNAQLFSIDREPERRPCEREPEAYVRDFELQLMTGFESDSSCKGLEVTKVSEIKQQPRDLWLLSVDRFEPKAHVQKWNLTHAVAELPAGKWEDSKGIGGPSQIAHAVCAIVTQAGATIRH